MFVESIKKGKKKGKYIILIDNKEYEFSENIIVEYRFTLGHETNLEELNNAIASEELESFYSKALNYAIKYGKCEAEVKSYLYDKGVSRSGVYEIIKRLKKNRILVDERLIDSVISSYIRGGNGITMIRHKLKEKGFSKELIDSHIDMIDYDEYINALNDLYKKIKNKYSKDEDRIRIMKIKRYLFNRGYSMSDIELLDL